MMINDLIIDHIYVWCIQVLRRCQWKRILRCAQGQAARWREARSRSFTEAVDWWAIQLALSWLIINVNVGERRMLAPSTGRHKSLGVDQWPRGKYVCGCKHRYSSSSCETDGSCWRRCRFGHIHRSRRILGRRRFWREYMRRYSSSATIGRHRSRWLVLRTVRTRRPAAGSFCRHRLQYLPARQARWFVAGTCCRRRSRRRLTRWRRIPSLWRRRPEEVRSWIER